MFSVKPQDGMNLVIGTAKKKQARYRRHLESHQYNEVELSLYLNSYREYLMQHFIV